MDRRELIKYIGLITGAVVVGGNSLLIGCATEGVAKNNIDRNTIKLFEEIAEVILPKTNDLAGAKDAKVGKMMKTIVQEHYSEEERNLFLEGLQSIEEDNFMRLSEMEKQDYLLALEKDSAVNSILKKTDENGNKIEIPHAYIMIRQLTILGYLSSETVAKTAFNYLPVPGKFEKCVEVVENTKPMYYRQAPNW
jgi:hypothetical protein